MMSNQNVRDQNKEREGVPKQCASCECIFRDYSENGELTCKPDCKPQLRGRYYILIGLGSLLSLLYLVS